MGNRATLRSGEVVEFWDYDAVCSALRAAGTVLVLLHVRGCRPSGIRIAQPVPVRSGDESYGWDAAIARRPLPGPDEIALYDRVSGWIAGRPEHEERVALWAMVNGRPLRWLGRRLRCSHVTAGKCQRRAVLGLVGALNGVGRWR